MACPREGKGKTLLMSENRSSEPSASPDLPDPAGPSVERREFLMMTTAALGTVGGVCALWPLVDSMNPAADVAALGTLDVDISQIQPGQGLTVMWRGVPVFIRHRTPAEISAAQQTPLAALLDPEADTARVKAGHSPWLVVVGVCTHLGCVPTGQKMTDPKGSYGGWLCPCHGSEYDVSGRVRKGPAPTNLPVPPYHFVSDTLLRLGEVA